MARNAAGLKSGSSGARFGAYGRFSSQAPRPCVATYNLRAAGTMVSPATSTFGMPGAVFVWLPIWPPPPGPIDMVAYPDADAASKVIAAINPHKETRLRCIVASLSLIPGRCDSVHRYLGADDSISLAASWWRHDVLKRYGHLSARPGGEPASLSALGPPSSSGGQVHDAAMSEPFD